MREDSSTLPRVIGDYEIVREIGRGGMGIVYLARSRQDKHQVALKVMTAELLQSPESMLRFQREVRSLTRLKHNNIVQVFDSGIEKNTPYYVMEYVEGKDLDAWMGTLGNTLPDDEQGAQFLDIMIQCCQALEFIHNNRIIHRDIKPGNIMITRDNMVKLMDFGLARDLDYSTAITQSGTIVGTIDYMSPEQISGKRLDARADLYSLGVIFYLFFTGKLPFQGNNPVAIMLQHLNHEPIPCNQLNPRIPPSVVELIERLLVKSPLNRVASAVELREILHKLLESGLSMGEGDAVATRDRIAANGHTAIIPAMKFQPQMVGRETEIEELSLSFKDFEAGMSQLATIYGDAGIGKTFLLSEFRSLIRTAPVLKFHARCDEYSGGAYHVFSDVLLDLLRQLGPFGIDLNKVSGIFPRTLIRMNPAVADMPAFAELPAPADLDPELEQQRLFDTFSKLLSLIAQNRVIFISIEDIQYIDEVSQELLKYLLRTLVFPPEMLGEKTDRPPFFIVLTYRQKELEDKRSLRKLLRSFRREYPLKTLKLKNLEYQELEQMLQSMLGKTNIPSRLVKRVSEDTEGNPYFAEEMVKSLFDDGILQYENDAWVFNERQFGKRTVPQNIQDLVQKRLERLKRDEKALLTTAAVIGRRFDADLLMEVMDIDEDELEDVLDELLKENIIRELDDTDGEVYEFAQNLFREIMYQQVTGRRLRKLHANIAETIEDFYQNKLPQYHEALAFHYFEAEEFEKAFDYYFQAAEKAMYDFSHEKAIEYIERAFQSYKECDEDFQEEYAQAYLKLYLSQGKTYSKTDRYSDALISYKKVQDLAERQNALTLLAESLVQSAMTYHLTAEYDKAKESTDKALEYFTMAQDEDGQAKCYRFLALIHDMNGDYQAAYDMLEKAKEIFSTKHNHKELAICLHYMGNVLISECRYEQAEKFFLEAMDLAAKEKDKQEVASIQNCLAINALEQGDYRNALNYFKASRDTFSEVGHLYGMVSALNGLGNAYLELGDYHQALNNFHQALQIEQRQNDVSGIMMTLNNLGEAYLELGDFTRAEKAIGEALPLCNTLQFKIGEGTLLRNKAMLAFYRGDYEEALRLVDMAYDQFKSMESHPGIVKARNLKALIFCDLGDEENAERILMEMLQIIADKGVQVEEPVSKSLLARIHLRRGEFEKAEQMADDALKKADILQDLKSQTMALVVLVDIAYAKGDHSTAFNYCAQAFNIAETSKSNHRLAQLSLKMGMIREAEGDRDSANEYYRQAEELAKSVNYNDILWKARYHQGKITMEHGEKEFATEKLSEALKVLTGIAGKIMNADLQFKFLCTPERAKARKYIVSKIMGDGENQDEG